MNKNWENGNHPRVNFRVTARSWKYQHKHQQFVEKTNCSKFRSVLSWKDKLEWRNRGRCSQIGILNKKCCVKHTQVKINRETSTIRTATVGVPQGPALGPLLFNIHILDMSELNFCTTANRHGHIGSSLEESRQMQIKQKEEEKTVINNIPV